MTSNNENPTTPLVTVLLPVLNGQEWIFECLKSLVAQTFTDYEILIIDDGCTDSSIQIAEDMSLTAIRIIKGPKKGLGAALALGVNLIKSPFIARQDQDDFSNPQRLEKQVAYMNSHPECVIVGTNAFKVDELGLRYGTTKVPLDGKSIKLQLNLYNPFVHTSVLMRRESVLAAGNYHVREGMIFAEDYDLWSRMSHTGDFCNLREALVSYRSNPRGISEGNARELRTSACAIAVNNVNTSLGFSLTKYDSSLISSFYGRSSRISVRDALRLYGIMFRLFSKFGFPPPLHGFRLHDFLAPMVWVLRKPHIPDRLPFDEKGYNMSD